MGNSSSNSRESYSSKNPLIIPEILCKVFDYLPAEDLKNCHLVCKTWNSIGYSYFGLQLRIPEEDTARKKCIEKFAATFSLSENFDCIEAYHKSEAAKVVYDGKNECSQNEEANNTSLNFNGFNLMIFDGCNKLLKCYDLSPIIIERKINKITIIGCYLCHKSPKSYRRIPVRRFTPVAIFVDLMCESLSSVKSLRLFSCQLRTTKNTPRISVKEIKLDQVQILRGKQHINLVNEIFDFTHARKIFLNPIHFARIWSVVILDMDDVSCKTFTSIFLSHVELRNWKTSTWNVNKFTLEYIQNFHDPENENICQMKIKELEFIRCGKIYPSFIPPSVEKLLISWKFDVNDCRVDAEQHNLKHLENLKSVCLTGLDTNEDEDFETQPDIFFNCSHLECIHFGNEILSFDIVEVNNVMQKIILQPLKYEHETARNCGWEQFIVINKILDDSYHTLYMTKLNIGDNTPIRRIVIALPSDLPQTAFKNMFDADLIRVLGKSNVVVIGPMKWNLHFERLGKCDNVDNRKKKFLVFENNVAKVIAESEFKTFESRNYCDFCKQHLTMNYENIHPDLSLLGSCLGCLTRTASISWV